MKLIVFLLAIIAFAFATDFGILFKKADLNFINSIEDWNLKGVVAVEELKRTAEVAQADVISMLSANNVQYKSYYIVNMIVVTDPKPDLLEEIKKMKGVVGIEKYGKYHIIEPRVDPYEAPKANVEWSVEMVRAPQAWAMGYNGSGIVVANLDTGVYADHPDLITKYRGYNPMTGQVDHDYNWYDGVRGQNCKTKPCDQHGHGTHTMGTMVGSSPNLIVGVAPGAKWIACRSFSTGGATVQDIMNCFEWFLEPTDVNGRNPDVSKRPHIINHSWGGSSPTQVFNDAIDALHLVGSLNFVSAGNSGSRCSSLGWPGAYNASFTSGALAYKSSQIVYFSSRGPVTGNRYVKPDVATPGERINSCKPGGGYQTMSGTSMSSPCTTGAAAVILSKRRDLIGKMEALKELMFATCTNIRSLECSSTREVPNNVYGWGLVNIEKALNY